MVSTGKGKDSNHPGAEGKGPQGDGNETAGQKPDSGPTEAKGHTPHETRAVEPPSPPPTADSEDAEPDQGAPQLPEQANGKGSGAEKEKDKGSEAGGDGSASEKAKGPSSTSPEE